MIENEPIVIHAGELYTISCFDCSTDCRIEHEPSASRNCPDDVQPKQIAHCPYCGSTDIEGIPSGPR